MEIYPIHKLEFSYELKEYQDLIGYTIEYRVLSKKELLNLTSKYYKENTPNNTFKLNVVKTSILPKYYKFIELLSDNTINDLYEKIMKVSEVTTELINELERSFKITNSENLKSDTWNCEVCKARGLQKARNCGFLKDCDDCDKTFQIFVEGELYHQCPLSLIDNNLLQAGYQCYFMYNKGLLPESGGMFDQTMFFNEVALSVFSWIEEQKGGDLDIEGEL